MKKSLLTIGAVAAFAAGACGQGAINIGSTYGGFNTASSSSAALTGWYTGSLTMSVFTIDAAGESTLATTINSDETSVSTVGAGIALIESDFTAQAVGTEGGAAGTEAASQAVLISDGGFLNYGIVDVGTAGTLPTSTDIYYALVFTGGTGNVEGAIVLNNPSGGTLPNTSPANSLVSMYPTDNQNVLLTPVPEPTTLALAGLGGLSMLFLRRRKS